MKKKIKVHVNQADKDKYIIRKQRKHFIAIKPVNFTQNILMIIENSSLCIKSLRGLNRFHH